MPSRTYRAAAVIALSMLLIACSATQVVYGDDPYARCIDLGDLALSSNSRADAQRRMVARVVELGGDTLLFGERGRTGRLAEVPEEIVERRSGLLAEDEVLDPQPAVAITTVAAPEAEAVAAQEAAGDPQRAGRAVVEEIEESSGDLWYYGAALRCDVPE
jgi:hypothetical protein